MRRTTLVERDPRRAPFRRGRVGDVVVERAWNEARGPLVEQDLSDLGEGCARDGGGRLVVEDETAALVGDQCRRREVRRELPREDEHEVLLARRVHAQKLGTSHAPVKRVLRHDPFCGSFELVDLDLLHSEHRRHHAL